MIPADIRAQVVESRRAQGLPDHVTAETFLYQLATEVLDRGRARREGDMAGRNDAPTTTGTRAPRRPTTTRAEGHHHATRAP
jgi:hypothetical protein